MNGGWLEERFPEVAAAMGEYKFRGDSTVKGRCPNGARHKKGDRHHSFVCRLGDTGSLQFKCLAGCDRIDVLRSIPGNDQFRPWRIVCHDRPKPQGVMNLLVKEYRYLDPDSVEWCQVCRFVGPRGKDFRPRRKLPHLCGDEWVWNLLAGWVKRVEKPYGVDGYGWVPCGRVEDKPQPGWVPVPEATPHLYNANIATLLHDRVLTFVEGEKDADTLSNLGLVAITTQGGAAQRLFPKQYADLLKGRHVVFLPDHDVSGDEYAKWYIGCAVTAKAASVTRLDLPGLPEKGDVSDWVFQNRKDAKDVGPNSTPAKLLKELAGRQMGYSRRRLREMFAGPEGRTRTGRSSPEAVPAA